MTTILIIEDDQDISELLSIYVHNEGFRAVTAATVNEALQLYRQHSPDLMLCDIKLPDGDGTELVSEIRKQSDIPIIFISSNRETEDILNGFELGGDDYITKPFDTDIVMARIKAQLRRYRHMHGPELGQREQDEVCWQDDRLTLYFDSWEVILDGEPISLSTKEMQLLFLFAQHPGQVFSVNQLYDQIWGLDGWSDSRTVMVHIHKLRKKIELDVTSPRYIITVRGIGYKFPKNN